MAMLPSSGRSLRGKRFLVTRPEGQATGLVEGIRGLGGEVAHIPLLAIEAVTDQSALERIAGRLADYRACIFISANAARIAWPALSKAGWPQGVAGAAVGPGTARTLQALGVSEVVVPVSRFDSEGLLAEPFFTEDQCRDQAFALIRGEGGRDFLAQSLRARGALVDEAAIYRRSLHPQALSRLQAWLDAGTGADTLLISSSESLQRIMGDAPQALADVLRKTPMVVPHSRIAEKARALGCSRLAVSAGGDDGMLAFLQTYNEIK